MKLFEIILLEDNSYNALIIETSCESPTALIGQIENELTRLKIKGKVLLDILMYSGNSDERFLVVFFDGKKLNMNTLKPVKVEKNSNTRKMTAMYFQNHPEIVEYSILNSFQKKLILKGCAI